jgi:hypothetical protein
MRFGTWHVRRLYRACSFTAATRELARYKLDLVGLQEDRWDKASSVRTGGYEFFFGNDTKIFRSEKDFLYTTE